MISTNLELNKLIKQAIACVEALSPEDRAAHRREQAISWAAGQYKLSRWERGYSDLTPEEELKLSITLANEYDKRKHNV